MPAIIYHFTDDVGLRGIFESGSMWCTDIFSLNDPSEFKYGVVAAHIMLENQLANGPSEIKKFCNHISNALRSGVVDFAHFHVCCFSETVEDLAQWRAYADDGCGFAIGFDAPIMKKQFDSDITASDVQLFPVIYDDDRLSDLLSDLVTEYLSRMSVLLKMKVDLEIRSQFILQFVPIRLSPIPTTSRVLPIPRVKLGLGRAAISPAMSSAS